MTLRRKTLSVFVVMALALTAAIGQERVLQTNSGSGNIHLIDPATNKVVGEVTGVPVNHGAAGSPDGKRLYFSSEAEQVLAVVDSKTLAITKKIKLSARPNNIAINKDGSRIYVGIISQPGAIDVIDTVSLERISSIPTKGGIHNLYVTPDGKYVVAGSIAGKVMSVIDTKTNEIAWTLFDEGIRPMAIEANPDGSTKRVFVNVNNFHGFVVVDFATHKETARITLPEIPVEKRAKGTFNNAPSHGLGVAPNGKTLWVTSRMNRAAYAYSLPDLKYLGGTDVGSDPDWITFSSDSKTVYVACSDSNAVSAIDVASIKEVARIPVGEAPKRNTTVTLR